ncbi:hypothetical protein GE21DRAFT_1011019 [Neurospora crassa]|nr:hypothetical protein GE21DRAFT_1011019 [Neurospora crassa]
MKGTFSPARGTARHFIIATLFPSLIPSTDNRLSAKGCTAYRLDPDPHQDSVVRTGIDMFHLCRTSASTSRNNEHNPTEKRLRRVQKGREMPKLTSGVCANFGWAQDSATETAADLSA